jgi:hypothetical protein
VAGEKKQEANPLESSVGSRRRNFHRKIAMSFNREGTKKLRCVFIGAPGKIGMSNEAAPPSPREAFKTN